MHLTTPSLALLALAAGGASRPLDDTTTSGIPEPPSPEPIDLAELPLPPVAPTNDVGACTAELNPRGTGCIERLLGKYLFQAGDFTPDGNHIIATVNFVGAPASPDPASIYSGAQLILLKTDGTTFSNGDYWKCLTCAVPASQKQSIHSELDYPHVFRSGTKALFGRNILDCNGNQLSDDACTPETTNIYPIYWPFINSNGTEVGGSQRELRMHPNDEHLGWSSLTSGGQNAYFGRLVFNAAPTTGDLLAPRYELEDVDVLFNADRAVRLSSNDAGELTFHDDAITIGELRGFSGTGDEIIYVGQTYEANNIDISAINIATGVVRRVTEHPEYVDPISFSADNKWIIACDTRGTNRQMFMSGMRYIPPVIDLITTTAAASTRNNGQRRFFEPILIDGYGDRGSYFGQAVNGAGNGSSGSINDPNWNARADPAFSHDGTQIVYWETIATGRECGGENPLPCETPTTDGGREYRVMLAKLTTRSAQAVPAVADVPSHLSWATAFPPGTPVPALPQPLLPGNYTLKGAISGLASVQLFSTANALVPNEIDSVAVSYADYADVDGYVLNGYENVTVTIQVPNFWLNLVDWYSDITQTGVVNATKKTSLDGFHLSIDAQVNIFEANGTLSTTIDGVTYEQPANGT